MRKTGILLALFALALFLLGWLWPEEAFNDQVYIHAAVELQDAAQGNLSREDVDRQTQDQVDGLYDRLELRGRHFIMAGAFLFPLGISFWLIGRQLEEERRKPAEGSAPSSAIKP